MYFLITNEEVFRTIKDTRKVVGAFRRRKTDCICHISLGGGMLEEINNKRKVARIHADGFDDGTKLQRP